MTPDLTDDLTIQALGTQVRARGAGAFAALREVSRLEALLTRFKPSALTRLNEVGELLNPPAELVQAVQHAVNIALETSGLVTPAVLPALEAAGYTTAPGAGPQRSPVPVPDVGGIELSAERIWLPAGVRLDLGGSAKSWIVQEAARLMSGDFLLDAGGDLIVQAHDPVTIGIETPSGVPAFLNLPAGRYGVATSSVLKRAWVGGHHLIDPRTARSAATTFVQVTALTSDVTVAEILTKLALLNATPVLQEWLGRFPDSQLLAFDRAGQGHVLHDVHSPITPWKRWAA